LAAEAFRWAGQPSALTAAVKLVSIDGKAYTDRTYLLAQAR
jgi:hypothetical protein